MLLSEQADTKLQSAVPDEAAWLALALSITRLIAGGKDLAGERKRLKAPAAHSCALPLSETAQLHAQLPSCDAACAHQRHQARARDAGLLAQLAHGRRHRVFQAPRVDAALPPGWGSLAPGGPTMSATGRCQQAWRFARDRSAL